MHRIKFALELGGEQLLIYCEVALEFETSNTFQDKFVTRENLSFWSLVSSCYQSGGFLLTLWDHFWLSFPWKTERPVFQSAGCTSSCFIAPWSLQIYNRAMKAFSSATVTSRKLSHWWRCASSEVFADVELKFCEVVAESHSNTCCKHQQIMRNVAIL